MSEPANWLCVKMGAASDPEHAKACVFCLTTRLAEAQENLRAANRRAIVVADESYKAGVASAETRLAEVEPQAKLYNKALLVINEVTAIIGLRPADVTPWWDLPKFVRAKVAEVERERDEAREAGAEYIRRTDPALACGTTDDPAAGKCGNCRACALARAESDEQLLSEMAEGMRAAKAAIPTPLLPESYYADQRRGALCADGRHEWCFNRTPQEANCDCSCHKPVARYELLRLLNALLAKYDARAAEAR